MPELSYVRGCSQPPLLSETIGDSVLKAARLWPGREALVVRHQRLRWTYAELAEKAQALAGGLLDLGLEPGDRVGIWSPNNSEWVLTQLATAMAGLVLVTINPAYQAAELQYALHKSGAKALVLAPGFKGTDYFAALRTLVPELESAAWPRLKATQLPELRLVVNLGG